MSQIRCSSCPWKGSSLGRHLRHCPGRSLKSTDTSTLSAFPNQTTGPIHQDDMALSGDDFNDDSGTETTANFCAPCDMEGQERQTDTLLFCPKRVSSIAHAQRLIDQALHEADSDYCDESEDVVDTSDEGLFQMDPDTPATVFEGPEDVQMVVEAQDRAMLQNTLSFIQEWTDTDQHCAVEQIASVLNPEDIDTDTTLRQFSTNEEVKSGNDEEQEEGQPKSQSASSFNTHPNDPSVSYYNPYALRHTEYFSFRLELALLVDSLKPKPPNGFIDNLLELLQKYSGSGQSKLDLSRKHVLNETFLERVRKLTGHTSKPEEVVVGIESASYGNMDQYDIRNPYRDTATLIRWNAFDQVRSILGCRPITGNLDNLVVNQNGDPFGKYEPPGERLSEVMSGDWYPRAHAAMIRRHEERTDLDCKHPPFLIPWMFGMDATGVDQYSRYKTEPLLMSLAIIKEDVRNKTQLSWKPLGLMPPLDHKSKNARQRERLGDRIAKLIKAGINTRNYHKVLGPILASFLELQEHGLVLELCFGEERRVCHCYFPLALWMGDIKSQDMLGGRVMSHRKNSPRLCWQCWCCYIDIDNVDHVCGGVRRKEYTDMVKNCQDITVFDPDRKVFYGPIATSEQRAEFVERYTNGTLEDVLPRGCPRKPEPIMEVDRFEEYVEYLKSKGFVRVDSVLNDIDYGDSPWGQFAALGIDLLHSLPGGVIKQAVINFIHGLPSATKELFESVADRIFLQQRSSESSYFPRMTFTHGCTNLTEMTCREWVGLMMTILIVCRSYSGSAVLDQLVKKTNRVKAKGELAANAQAEDNDISDDEGRDECSDDGSLADTDKDPVPPGSVLVDASDFIHVAESILAFYGYANSKSFWRRSDTASGDYFQQSCDILFNLLKEKCPRNRGNRWKIAKAHVIFKRMRPHIQMFGAPTHSNCESLERSVSIFAKTPSVNTNRQSYLSVTKTTAKNLDTSLMLKEAEFHLYGEKEELEPTVVTSSEGYNIARAFVERKPEWNSTTSPEDVFGLKDNPDYRVGYFSILDRTTGEQRTVFRGEWQRSRAVGHMEAPPMVINHLYEHYFEGIDKNSSNSECKLPSAIDCYTECFLTSGKRIRCHPNYRSSGPWFDWVLLECDPFNGVNMLFDGYEGSEDVPVPSPYKNVIPRTDAGEALLDDGGNPILPVTSTRLFNGASVSLGIQSSGVVDDEKYFPYAWKPLCSSLPRLFGKTRAVLKREEYSRRLFRAPGHCYVSDIPQPSMRNFYTDHQKKFGEKVVPAKVLCIFRDPRSGTRKALVHPCCHRTLENYVQSSTMVDNWTLQYSYLEESSEGETDRMVARTAVVDVGTEILDRIAAMQEFPGMNDILNPSLWDVSPVTYGLKVPTTQGIGMRSISTNHPANMVNRRRASDAHRNVMVPKPMEHWGKEFTTEFTNGSRGVRKRRR